MSRSVVACRNCKEPLGFRHHTGQLHVLAGVTVYADPEGQSGAFVRMICPGCRKHRDYHGRVVVTGNGDPCIGEKDSAEATSDQS